MSKKRFLDGLESLFAESSTDEQRRAEEALLTLPDRSKPKKKTTIVRRESSGKTFSDELSSFLADAIEQPEDQTVEVEVPLSGKRSRKKDRPSAGAGLDALVRNTLDPEVVTDEEQQVRRLTLTLRRAQLEKLRQVAHRKKVPLRQLVAGLVSDFLDQCDTGKS